MIFYRLVKPADHIFKYNHSSIRLIFKVYFTNDCLYENINLTDIFNFKIYNNNTFWTNISKKFI